MELLYIYDLHTKLGMESTTMQLVGNSMFSPSSSQAFPQVEWDCICEGWSNARNVLYQESMYCQHYIQAKYPRNQKFFWIFEHPSTHIFLMSSDPWKCCRHFRKNLSTYFHASDLVKEMVRSWQEFGLEHSCSLTKWRRTKKWYIDC